MTPRLPIALAIIGLASTSILSTPFAARAQETSPKAETATPEKSTMPKAESMTKIPGAAPEDSEFPMLSAQDRVAFLDARLAALHAGLELTTDQEKLWPPVEQAIRDFRKLVWTQREKMRESMRERIREKMHRLDPVALLQLRSANMIARGESMKKIADAAGPLYATLTDEQKHRLPMLLRVTLHPFGHGRFMMGRWGYGMMGPHMMCRWHHGMMGPGMMERELMGPGMMGPGMMGRGMIGPGMMDGDEE